MYTCAVSPTVKERFIQFKNALLTRWPWLGGFLTQVPGAASAIAFAYVGVSLTLGARQENASWFVLTLPGVVFTVATVLAVLGVLLNVRRNRSIRSLNDQIGTLNEQIGTLQGNLDQVNGKYRNLLEEVRGSYYSLCSSELTSILRNALGYGDTERISAYRHREAISAFQLIGRYSENPTYNKPGRPVYPEDEGVIRDAWGEGVATASLPDRRTDEEEYYRTLEVEWNIGRSTAEDLTMGSREYVACALYEPQGEHRVAVIVVESDSVGILSKDDVTRVINGEGGKDLYNFLEAMRPVEPDFELPIGEGF